MARDVEYNVTASDRSDPALASAEAKYRASQDRIRKINEDSNKKILADADRYNTKIGRSLETVFGRTAPKLSASLAGVFADAGASGGPLLAAGIAAGAPLIGATISAAIVGGAGLGGVLGGVYLVADDPRVKAAGTRLATNLLASLKTDAGPFVEPVLASIQRIEAEAAILDGRFKRIFTNSAAFLPGLTGGALRAVDGIVSGLDKLIGRAGPVMAELAHDFDQIGQHAGQALETISGGSAESAEALHDLVNGLTFLIDVSAGTVRGLTEIYGVLNKVGAASGALGPFLDLIGHTGGEAELAAAQTARMAAGLVATGQAAQAAHGPVATLSDQINALTQSGRGLYDSTTQAAEATATLKRALEDNGKTLDENTVKGRANRQALSGLAAALIGQYNATVAVNGEGAKANGVATANRAAFIRLASQFTRTRGEAAALANQMGLIPGKKTTAFYANTHDAEARVAALKSRIDAVHSKTVSIGVVIAQSQLRRVENTLNRAGGSLYNAAGPAWFASDTSSGRSRTAPPTPVNVTNSLQVLLDGAPFRAMSVRTVRNAADREAWRRKVGTR